MITGPEPSNIQATRPTFGLSYEDFVGRFYRAAVPLGVPTREGLRESGYSDEDITVATSELVARGFLTTGDDPDSWAVVPPRAAFSAYAAEMEHRMNLTRATMGPMELMWRRSLGRRRVTEMPTDIDLLVDVDDIVQRVLTLHQSATTRLWWAVDGSTAARSLLHRAMDEPGLLEVGTHVERRLMMDTSLLQDEAALAHLHRCRGAGHEVRVGNGIPFSMVVGDDTVLVDLSAFDELGQGSFEARLAPAVSAVSRLAEEIFTLSTPYGETVEALAADGSAPPLDERDRRILALLTVGASDQVAARQLGVSVRTVERRVRYLMEHLGAATRFQAGVQAVRRGWV